MTAAEPKKKELAPPMLLEQGSIVTLRMRGHTRSPDQQEYFATAIVLAQYMPQGEIDALVWDSSAGTHFAHSYQIRDLGTRGSGDEREMYVLQDNIGAVLFSPEEFRQMTENSEWSRIQIGKLEHRLAQLEKELGVKK